ncbi:MAG: hypothetical protein ACD_11C00029G0005 [uncultured bacterium]|nr:MAG: hypothetical protein ACD_11C00029G0005 [uncultured bacterium]HBR71833.1 ligand-binding protein SH3 [Candidatus Moranbacteria bacterium]
MHDLVINFFIGFPKELATFLIAIVPITELRASIPVAINQFQMSAFSAWFWSVAGTYFAMLLILFLLDPVAKILSKYISFFAKFFEWLFEHTRKKTNGKMEKYGEWSIFILAATPVPLIGGLTGALAAFVFGIHPKKSLPLLLLGTMISGAIVVFLTKTF